MLVFDKSVTLFDKLKEYDKESLKLYGSDLGLTKLSKFRKDELVQKVVDKLLDLDVMFYRGAILSDKQIAVLERGFNGPTSYSEDEAYLYFDRAMRIYNTIAMTGLGDEEYPFCVTSVADEYEFMRNYLELYEYESQALVGVCDVFTLKETSEYYSDKKIYFDATRPLEMLAKALGQ